MAKKDFGPTENTDRDQHSADDRQPHHNTAPSSENAKGVAGTDVKNAHAAGDGSYGRNDSSLPEKEEEQPGTDAIY